MVLQGLSVRLSVRLSNVRTVTKHKILVPEFLYQMKDHSFLLRRMVGAAGPFYLKIWAKLALLIVEAKTSIFNRYSPVAPQP